MQFCSGAIAVCEIKRHEIIKYKVINAKTDFVFTICFQSGYPQGILYKVIENVYLSYIDGFVSQLITVFN